MAATTNPPEIATARFDRAERVLHWTNAALFAVVVFTAGTLYVGPLSTIVGRRELMKNIHVYTGLLLPVPLLVTWFGPWRAGFRADVSRLNRWQPDDYRWLRSLGRDRRVKLGKFNPGQKVNAAFTLGVIAVSLVTGLIMRWFGPFPLEWRTGATFVHDWVAITFVVVVTGHVFMGLRDRNALRAMLGRERE